MSTVLYQEGFADDLPLLLFDYGIIELGGPPPLNIEAKIRTMLMEQGMRVIPEGDDVPHVIVKASIDGNTLLIPWFEDESPDEMEMSEHWLEHARSGGGFVAIYLNLRPDNVSLSELRSMGALMGIITLDGS